MKKPWRKVKIFGALVPVFKARGVLEQEQALGFFKSSNQKDQAVIVLEASMDKCLMELTLLHEMLHAALHRTNVTSALDPGLEEILVDQCARVFVENFKLTWK